MKERLYTIKEAAMRTGLSTQLIRKWEERYEAVAPQRMANGYRGYTIHDVDTLLWLKREVDEGVPIGMAVAEWKRTGQVPIHPVGHDNENVELLASMEEHQDFNVPMACDWNQSIEKLLQCFIQLDLNKAQRIYEQLLATHHLENMLLKILEPTLAALGERWEKGEIPEYKEHFGSQFIRDKILLIRNVFRTSEDSPLLVTACGPGERHEHGILFIGFFAQREGFRVMDLGTAPSGKGLIDCLNDLQPIAFTFSFSIQERLEESRLFLLELDRCIRDNKLRTHIFIGGRAVYEDCLMPGTNRVNFIAGDARSSVDKIKSRLLIR